MEHHHHVFLRLLLHSQQLRLELPFTLDCLLQKKVLVELGDNLLWAHVDFFHVKHHVFVEADPRTLDSTLIESNALHFWTERTFLFMIEHIVQVDFRVASISRSFAIGANRRQNLLYVLVSFG